MRSQHSIAKQKAEERKQVQQSIDLIRQANELLEKAKRRMKYNRKALGIESRLTISISNLHEIMEELKENLD